MRQKKGASIQFIIDSLKDLLPRLVQLLDHDDEIGLLGLF